jgi:hypothetical protein
MVLVNLLRHSWLGLLAILPATVLARLDGWARRQAEARAQRRLRSLLPRG